MPIIFRVMQPAKNSMSVFGKISQSSKQKPLRVMVLGLAGIGKTALTVRYVTKRFIGEYDPTLEKIYVYQTVVGKEQVIFEILDSAGQSHETECLQLEANIRWAEAFVLMYSVTDKCSFDECNRLKFLINYNKRRRRLQSSAFRDSMTEVPVILVGNKKDQLGDRMITKLEGKKRSKDIGCVGFHEISVRESPEEVQLVFEELYQEWKNNFKTPKLKRSTSDLHHGPVNLDSFKFITSANKSTMSPLALPGLGPPWADRLLESRQNSLEAWNPRFRDRASTDGSLHAIKKIPYEKVKRSLYDSPIFDRRMSISMRGSNAVC